MSRAFVFPSQVDNHVISDNATALSSRYGVINETARSEEYHAGAANTANAVGRASRKVAFIATAAALGAEYLGLNKLRNGAVAVAIAAGGTALGSSYIEEANTAIAKAHTDQLHELGVKMTGVELANTSTALPIQ